MSRRNRERRKKPAGYAEAVRAASERAMAEGRLRPGNVYVIDVRHEGRCALLRGGGPCDCAPEVRPPERVPAPDEN
jgi:hypothetical protein